MQARLGMHLAGMVKTTCCGYETGHCWPSDSTPRSSNLLENHIRLLILLSWPVAVAELCYTALLLRCGNSSGLTGAGTSSGFWASPARGRLSVFRPMAVALQRSVLVAPGASGCWKQAEAFRAG